MDGGRGWAEGTEEAGKCSAGKCSRVLISYFLFVRGLWYRGTHTYARWYCEVSSISRQVKWLWLNSNNSFLGDVIALQTDVEVSFTFQTSPTGEKL